MDSNLKSRASRSTFSPQIIKAIHKDLDSGVPLSTKTKLNIIALFRQLPPLEFSDYKLTQGEKQILKMLADGHHYKTASHELGISIHTVNFHFRKIYTKLRVHSTAEAVAKALREDLV